MISSLQDGQEKFNHQLPVNYKIGIDGNDGYRLYINNKLVIDNWKKQSYSTRLVNYYFEKGKALRYPVEYFEPAGNAWFRLIWNIGVKDSSEHKNKGSCYNWQRPVMLPLL